MRDLRIKVPVLTSLFIETTLWPTSTPHGVLRWLQHKSAGYQGHRTSNGSKNTWAREINLFIVPRRCVQSPPLQRTETVTKPFYPPFSFSLADPEKTLTQVTPTECNLRAFWGGGGKKTGTQQLVWFIHSSMSSVVTSLSVLPCPSSKISNERFGVNNTYSRSIRRLYAYVWASPLLRAMP